MFYSSGKQFPTNQKEIHMKNVNAGTVRTWLAENGGAGLRGRIKASDAERFNKAHKGKAVFSQQSDAEKRHTVIPGVVLTDSAGRKVTKSVTVLTTVARDLAGPSSAGKRGRLPISKIALGLSAEHAATVADTFTK